MPSLEFDPVNAVFVIHHKVKILLEDENFSRFCGDDLRLLEGNLRTLIHSFQVNTMLEYEVIWGILVYGVEAVRSLSRSEQVKTLLAGPSPTSPMRRRLPTPLFPTLPLGNRSLHGP
jgi:hypothetical protein